MEHQWWRTGLENDEHIVYTQHRLVLGEFEVLHVKVGKRNTAH
jgi:hypothetical protein